jgi:hypothetical protein
MWIVLMNGKQAVSVHRSREHCKNYATVSCYDFICICQHFAGSAQFTRELCFLAVSVCAWLLHCTLYSANM